MGSFNTTFRSSQRVFFATREKALCKKKLLKAKRTTKTFEDPKCDVSKRMASKSAYSISLCLVLFLCSFADGKSVCSEEQLTESQRAFRNCVESAKAGIVSSHANSEDENVVCHSLENMLLTCDAEVNKLAKCTNKKHVENLKAIHLSSITDVIKAINHKVDVSQCSVFTEKTLSDYSVTSASNMVGHLSQEPELRTGPASGASTTAASFTLFSFLSLSLCALKVF